MADDELRIVFATASPDDAPGLVSTLVSESLVACGNILPGVRSIYRWQGQVCDDEEAVILMETTESRLPATMARLAEIHPYDVPKIVALAPTDVLPSYLAWAQQMTRAMDPRAGS